MRARKFIYHLEKKIYEPLITRIQENGYCLYHTATVLRLLENSAEGDKVAVQDVCGRISMSLLGVDAMIETMKDMKNKLALAIPLCASAESIDSGIDLKESQESPISLLHCGKHTRRSTLKLFSTIWLLRRVRRRARKRRYLKLNSEMSPGQRQKYSFR
jgi:hypothetical protein